MNTFQNVEGSSAGESCQVQASTNSLSLLSLPPSWLHWQKMRSDLSISDTLMMLIGYNLDVGCSIGDVFMLLDYYSRICSFCKLCVLANVMGACVWVGDL